MKFSVAALALAAPLAASLSLLEALKAHGDLDIFVALLELSPPLMAYVNSTANQTVLAPTDKAILDYQQANNISTVADIDQAVLDAELLYHFLPGTYPAASLGASGGNTVTTSLSDPAYASLGQGVGNVIYTNETSPNALAKRQTPGQTNNNATASNALYVYSGDGNNVTVTQGDIPFDHGYIHVVDGLLTLPGNISQTLQAASLGSLATALQAGNLTDISNSRSSITLLAPAEAAFSAPGVSSMTTAQITQALQYGTFFDLIAYSTALTNGQSITASSVGGLPAITVRKIDGALYFNNAKVLQANVITKNGVLHIIDRILFPNTTVNATVTVPPPPIVTGAAPAAATGSSAIALLLGVACLGFLL